MPPPSNPILPLRALLQTRAGRLGLGALLVVVAGAATLAAVFWGRRSPLPSSPTTLTNTARVVQAGVAVEMSISPTDPALAGQPLREGQTVDVRFTLTDSSTGAPYPKAWPAAWIDPHRKGETDDDAGCTAKLQALVSGGTIAKTAIDLNVFHVLVLGADGYVSIVDPRFGFGGSNLLQKVRLSGRGGDWALTADQNRLFVSIPGADRLAVIDTEAYRVATEIDTVPRPRRVVLQPDEGYLWVASDEDAPAGSGAIAAISPLDRKVAARIPLGAGAHDIAFSDDSRTVFVTSRDAGAVTIIDVRSLTVVRSVATGKAPGRVAYSSLAKAAYVTDAQDGTITVIDGGRLDVSATVHSSEGIGAIAFEPKGRYAFVVNPENDELYVLDAATNRVVQQGKMEKGPDQVAFSDTLAYVRHRKSSTVLMVPLAEVGTLGKPIQVVDFTGGQSAPGPASFADEIVRAPGGGAVLVANAADKAIYYYKEGMAAPNGSFSAYGAAPDAVLVVDRSLRERSPGVYETTTSLSRAGRMDVAFLVGSPRIKVCFPLEVVADTSKPEPVRVAVESLVQDPKIPARETTHLRFLLKDAATQERKAGLTDVSVLVYTPGSWHIRQDATPEGDGVYAVDLSPPEPGSYYAVVESRTIGLLAKMQRPVTFEAVEKQGGAR